MPNPGGKNGYGTKDYPPDDVLQETLLRYVKHGLKQGQKLPIEEAIQAIIDEVEPDVTQSNGPRYVKSKLKDKLILVPRQEFSSILNTVGVDISARDFVREVMLEHFGDGFNIRYPGKRKATIVRQALSAIGPFHEVSANGHEKLAAQALKMGNVGFPIYAWKDKWTAYLLKIVVVPDCRTAGAVGHLYLDFLEEIGIAPIQLNTDKGSETGWQYAIQTAIRDSFARNIDPNIYPAAIFLKSVHNTIIEAFWRWLHEKWGLNMREHILRGKSEHIYVAEVPFHRDLFNWIFPPLLQAQLDDFRIYWNQHTICSQPEKDMPSGHVPADALEHPGLFGGIDCGIRVPKNAIQEFRDALTEEVGPRESFLAWRYVRQVGDSSLTCPLIIWGPIFVKKFVG
ncbi:hypothetical protein GGX14DRAFT_403946 [Mycena pura]|uniref:Integrase catalytic domain-containing protein n=1 Tax=Mycena pura TaxID=153505 RepID=A0AAD6Y5U1_9AGAR|nr:hypothetical protein GGX14DRAFT_403946 [Mycena pura]